MLQPKKVKHRKHAEGPHARQGASAATRSSFGDYGLQAIEPRARDGAPDRGGARRDDAPREARRQGLDPHLPGQADHEEARRDPHGQGQGQPRGVGGRREAGPDPLRDGGRAPSRSRAQALRLAAHKLPLADALRASGRRSDEGEGAGEISALDELEAKARELRGELFSARIQQGDGTAREHGEAAHAAPRHRARGDGAAREARERRE